MISGVAKIGFVVQDVEKAIVFFTQTLGLASAEIERFPQPEGSAYVFIKTGTMIIELMPSICEAHEPLGFHHIAMRTDDTDLTYRTLIEEKGVPPMKAPSGAVDDAIRLADVYGPEHIRIRLFQSSVY